MLMVMDSGLDFTAAALRHNIETPSSTLKNSFQVGYGTTLRKHHNWASGAAFNTAMYAVPNKDDFYTKLAADQSQAQNAMIPWLEALEKRVAIINRFLKTPETDWEGKKN